MEIDTFQLSRIYSQGWNAAKKLLADGTSDVDEVLASKLNPYRAENETERWTRGFKEALQSRAGNLNRPRAISWRPAIEK